MPHVEASTDVPVDVDTLWRQVGSFQGVGDWHPMLTVNVRSRLQG